jgi:hypothetical protein
VVFKIKTRERGCHRNSRLGLLSFLRPSTHQEIPPDCVHQAGYFPSLPGVCAHRGVPTQGSGKYAPQNQRAFLPRGQRQGSYIHLQNQMLQVQTHGPTHSGFRARTVPPGKNHSRTTILVSAAGHRNVVQSQTNHHQQKDVPLSCAHHRLPPHFCNKHSDHGRSHH